MISREFREILIEERPFRVFQLYCSKCEEVLVEVSDLTESPLKNEALVLYQIENHSKETGHYLIDGNIEPQYSLQRIDATIEVNQDV